MSSAGLTDPAGRGAALVTGGGKRIGRAICLELARSGFDVVVHYRSSRDAAEAVADEARALGKHASTIQADLSVETEVKTLIPAAAAAAGPGPLSALINNASVFEPDEVGSLERSVWDAHLETNLRAPILLAQAFAAQAPDGSSIVNLLDQRVLKPDPRFFSYGLSRAGLWWATRTLAQALAPRVRVNGVGPGPTLPSVHQTPADFAAEAGATLLGQPVAPQAVASAVRWLLEAEFVTGQLIAVDAGQHLGWKTPDILE